MARQPLNSDTTKQDTFQPKSSFIQSASYDSSAETMTLTFTNGSTYNYPNVGLATWKSFQQSPDHSSFYAKAIKGRLTGTLVKRNPVGKERKQPLKTNNALNKGLIYNVKRSSGNLPAGLSRSIKRAGLSKEQPGLIPDGLYSR